MPIDRTYTLATLRDLIRIDSRNPGLEAGAPGEWEIAQHVNSLLRELGWEAVLHELGNRRANVVARRAGTGGGPSLMINVHLDTVGVEGMKDPFSAKRSNGRIWGRGAQDTKGGAAAALGLAKALTEAKRDLHGDLVLAFVADEEHKSIGTERLIQEVVTDAAIVLEPSDLDICVAHRGFGVFRLRTRGRTAHGGSSDLGIDANLHMGHFLVELDQLRDKWQRDHRHPTLGSATLHVPLLSGGRQLFMYADECNVDLECRTVPNQSSQEVMAELHAILRSLGQRIEDFQGSIDLLQWRSPFQVDPEALLVRTVLAATEKVRGTPAPLTTHSWWEDSALLAEVGIETLVLGPTGRGLHTAEEWVDAESVVSLAEILYHSALAYCGTG